MIRLAALLVLLQTLDVLSTLVGISSGAAEQNPVGQALLRAGPWLLIAAKMAATSLIIWLAAWMYEREDLGPKWARAGLAWCCIGMAAVVAWNGAVIFTRY